VGVKRPGREADHSPPSSVEVKNAWSYTSTPQYIFMAWCLVKHRDNFTFLCFTSLCLTCDLFPEWFVTKFYTHLMFVLSELHVRLALITHEQYAVPVLLNEHDTMKTYWRSEGIIAPFILRPRH
jgi:hypothetical protein